MNRETPDPPLVAPADPPPSHPAPPDAQPQFFGVPLVIWALIVFAVLIVLLVAFGVLSLEVM